MSELFVPSANIYIAESRIVNAGRGVFAALNIAGGSLIERCPVIEIPVEAKQQIFHDTKLKEYYFTWGDDQGAFCLGFGALYNDSLVPNAFYNKKFEERAIEFIALSDISRDEEITVNYFGDSPNETAM